ncbi:MAG: putative DNA-binding domain-containing protein [Polyangiales bacterium]
MLADRAKAMQRVCFDAEPSEADLELLGSPERWLVYRELVQNRLVQVINVAFARTKAAIGDRAFRRTVAEWLSAGGPKTRYLRAVPAELADFAIPIWQDTEVSWLAELARFEIASWNVRHAPRDPKPETEFAFDRRPVLSPAVEVIRLEYPVHKAPTPAAGYEPEPTFLCVYRDTDHRASTKTLNPLAADLLSAWKRADETVAESVQRIAAKHHTEIGPAFVEKLSAIIADFIIGGHSPPPAQ